MRELFALELSDFVGVDRPGSDKVRRQMLYAIFCYIADGVIGAWTSTEDIAAMARLTVEQAWVRSVAA